MKILFISLAILFLTPLVGEEESASPDLLLKSSTSQDAEPGDSTIVCAKPAGRATAIDQINQQLAEGKITVPSGYLNKKTFVRPFSVSSPSFGPNNEACVTISKK